jgi:hypothetical protein
MRTRGHKHTCARARARAHTHHERACTCPLSLRVVVTGVLTGLHDSFVAAYGLATGFAVGCLFFLLPFNTLFFPLSGYLQVC